MILQILVPQLLLFQILFIYFVFSISLVYSISSNEARVTQTNCVLLV